MVFERFRTRLVFVLRLNTIFGCRYRASTRPRLQAFKIRLEDESQVRTPIRQNLHFKALHELCNAARGGEYLIQIASKMVLLAVRRGGAKRVFNLGQIIVT